MTTDRQWDKKLTDFLKKAGEDIRRTTDDLKVEAQKLMQEVRDPHNQQKVKEVLGNIGTWTEKIARDAAVIMDAGVKKAEDVIAKASSRMGGQEGTDAKGREASTAGEGSAGPAKAPKRPRPSGAKASAKAKTGGKKPPPRKTPSVTPSQARASRPVARKKK